MEQKEVNSRLEYLMTLPRFDMVSYCINSFDVACSLKADLRPRKDKVSHFNPGKPLHFNSNSAGGNYANKPTRNQMR